MASRSVFRLAKCYSKVPVIHLRRLLATESAEKETSLNEKLKLDFGAYARAPHGKDVCEDAFFILDKHDIAAFGVADGVSSWRHHGFDASVYPNTLMANCIKYLEDKQGKIDPKHCLQMAHEEILKNNEVEAGSSTVCLGILDKESGILQTLNLGDSGFCIFREGETFFKSKEQYRHPNVPFQVGVKEIIDGKSVHHGNSPSDAVTHLFHLQPSDLLIWGTDGLFDNLYPEDIYDVINPGLPSEVSNLNKLSRQLTKVALSRAIELNPERITPREKRMHEYNEDSIEIPGGNFDDVTVVAIQIKAQ